MELSPTRRANNTARWLLLALLCPGAGATELAESLWHPDAETGDRRYCAGGYIEPPWPPATDAVQLTAGALQSHIGTLTTVTGGIVARQGKRLLTTAAMRIDERAAVARTLGPARLQEPGLHALGASVEMGLNGDQARVEEAEFVLTDLELRGTAALVEKRGERLRLSSASLTRCPPGRETWRLRAATIHVNTSANFATARHPRLTLGGVPVFYAPYARFPVRGERGSGFLVPSISYHGEDGIDLALPYYLNLAPNYDATLTPRLINARGLGIEAEFRHKSRATDTELGAALLPRDDDYNGEFSRADLLANGGTGLAFAPADRWLVSARHRGHAGNWRTLVDFTAVSDNDYFVDLGSEIATASRISVLRRGEIQYARGGLLAQLRAQGFQRLEPGPEPYRRLPEANLGYLGKLWGPLTWSLTTSWTAFERASGSNAVTGERLHVEPGLRLPLSRRWGFLALSARTRHTRYQLANVAAGVNAAPRRDIRLAIADGGLFFERAAGSRLQTLEPRLQYRYQSHADQDDLPRFDAARLSFTYQQLFRDNRFAGLDRFDDANQVAIGVTSRLLTADTGSELLSARLGAIAYLDDRRVTLDGQSGAEQRQGGSALVGELRAAFGATRVTSTLVWDANDNQLDEAGLGISYRRGGKRVFNVGYRRRAASDIDQTDVAFHWPLSRRWSAFGRWNHDWRFSQIIEAFIGIGYASCCLDAKLLWHRTIDAPRNQLTANFDTGHLDVDHGVALQFVFRGLGGFGANVDSRLARGIKGYQRD